MKKNPTFLLLLLTILFSSCYTSAISYNNLNRIERGMFPKDVIPFIEVLMIKAKYLSFVLPNILQPEL